VRYEGKQKLCIEKNKDNDRLPQVPTSTVRCHLFCYYNYYICCHNLNNLF